MSEKEIEIIDPTHKIKHHVAEGHADDTLVEEVYGELIDIFSRHYKDALLEAGRCIIKTFFDDDLELAKQKKPTKNLSYTKLITKIQDSSAGSPKKSWLFNAVNLVIQEHDCASVHTYGQLNISQKVKLLPVKDLTLKEMVIEEVTGENLSVKKMGEYIQKLKKPRKVSLVTIVKNPEKFIGDDAKILHDHDSLSEVDDNTRGKLKKSAKKVMAQLIAQLSENRSAVEQYGIFVADLKSIYKEKKKGKRTKIVKGTEEWASKNINCCTGCPNNCLYCYAKADALRRKQVTNNQWDNITIRNHDVFRKHPHYGGTVMFPTTHDIVPQNLYACIIVLENLLQAGNKVLIVSKPQIECITEICKYFRNYKDQILFRFSIGAMDNTILKFWEPNAPSYEERKECLQLAHSQIFDTSVSCEPMLDSENIDALVADLLPLVTNALWIGTMNETSRRVNVDSAEVKENLQRILDGQSEEALQAIYERHKKNPKIKWKDEVKRIVGLERQTTTGMDI